MDTNADQKLSEAEFVANIGRVDVKLSTPPRAIFYTLDEDGSGDLDLREFSIWLARIKFKSEELTDLEDSAKSALEWFPTVP